MSMHLVWMDNTYLGYRGLVLHVYVLVTREDVCWSKVALIPLETFLLDE